MRTCSSILIILMLLSSAAVQAQPIVGPVGQPQRPETFNTSIEPAAIEAAAKQASAFLLSQIGEDGCVAEEYSKENPRFGGRTVLSVYALLRAGVDPADHPELARAIDWTMQAELWGTYPIGFRTAAMSLLKDARAEAQLHRDVDWLLKAANSDGEYTYTKVADTDGLDYDNSNGHIAAFGIWSAQSRGVDIPLAYWKRIEQHWLDEQQPDGGWGYRMRPGPDGPTAQTYGSMTAAGVATLYTCFDRLGRQQFIRCKPAPHGEAITRGMAWLEENFSIRWNPRKGVEWYDFWLFGLQRVGSLSGRKLIGGVDWYAAGADQLLRRQHDDGSWGYGGRVDSTAFALLFLSHGRAPTLLSKVHTSGRWNARPRDAANLVNWLGYTYERRVGWQVIDIDADASDWDDARILYLSGAGPIALSDEQIIRLRQFVQRGGVILSEAACNNGDFTMDMHRIYQRMFPDYRLQQLERTDPRHPIYNLQFDNVQPRGLFAVHNGVRPLAIHAPQELSLGLELGPGETQRPTFNLLANLYLYLTEMGSTTPRGDATWQAAELFEPKQTLRVARIKYDGNYDPEPLAFDRLALMLAREQKVKLNVSWPMEPEKLSADAWPVAHMTGTEEFELTETQITALKDYLADGGTLIADAAGGSRKFAQSFIALIGKLVEAGKFLSLPQASPLYRGGPYDVSTVTYRRGAFEEIAAAPRRHPQLQAVYVDNVPIIIFSLEDISGGLVGYPLHGLRGYRPTSARHVMANLLTALNRRATAPAGAAIPVPTTAPAGTVELDPDADETVRSKNE